MAQIPTQLSLVLGIDSKPLSASRRLEMRLSPPRDGPLAIMLKDDFHSMVLESKESFAPGFCVSKIKIVTTVIA